jgi:rubrerythrin
MECPGVVNRRIPSRLMNGRMSHLEIMWKCLKCGHLWPNLGAALPEQCTSCGAPKTEFVLLEED